MRNILLTFNNESIISDKKDVVANVMGLRACAGLSPILNDKSSYQNAMSLLNETGGVALSLGEYKLSDPIHASYLNDALKSEPMNVIEFDKLTLSFEFDAEIGLEKCYKRVNIDVDVCGIITAAQSETSEFIVVHVHGDVDNVAFINVADIPGLQMEDDNKYSFTSPVEDPMNCGEPTVNCRCRTDGTKL